MRSIRVAITAIALCALVASPATRVCAADWPAFRGPRGNGHAADAKPPIEWGKNKNVRWKTPLPHPGNGSPIVVGDRVFIASANPSGEERSLLCFDRKDGKLLWTKAVAFNKQMPTHRTNPHGSSTPASDGKRVVVFHGSAGLHCYDLAGKALWQRDLGEFKHMWGYGTSPIIHEGKVILHAGPGKTVFITAIDLETGKDIWRTDEPVQGDGERNENKRYMGSWSTPIIARVDGADQVICSFATRVNGYDPATGKLLWYCDGVRGKKGDLAYTSPVLAGDVVVVMGGFNGPAFGVHLGEKDGKPARGDVTESHRLWRVEPNPQRIGSAVFVDGHLYMGNAGPALIQCIEPKTGKLLWRERTRGGPHWASSVYAGGHVYATGQGGSTLVYKPTPMALKVVAENKLGEHINATPAFAGGEVLIRSYKHLWCIAEPRDN